MVANLDKYPVYKGEDGFLYSYDPDTGQLWNLRPAEYAGKPGPPLPGVVENIGKLTLLGLFNLAD